MAFKRSGPPSRGGPSKGNFARGGGRGDSRGDSSRGGSRGDSRGSSRGGPRDFGDRPKRDFGDRPQRSFGDRPQRSGFEDRPQRSFDDRPQRDFGDRPQRNFDDRGPRRDRDMPFEDRPRRSFKQEGFGASRRRDDTDTRRPSGGRSFGDRPQRSFDDRPKRDFGDRPQRSFDDRPKRDFGDRPQRGGFDGGRGGPRPERREYRSDRPMPSRRDGFEKRPSASAEGEETGAPRGAMKGHELVIYGVHAVQAALHNPKRVVTTIWVTEVGEAHLEGAYDATRHPELTKLQRREIEQRVPDGAVHQGIAIAVEPLEDVYLSDVLAAANAPSADRQVVVVLDEVTDPHNVGAVLRSMSMFGASAMIVHKRNAPSVTGVMAKIATGAVEYVPMVPVTNLAKAMEELQMAGFYCLGLDEDATIALEDAPKTGHIALVLGGEGEGLRAKTRSTCNAIVSIPSRGEIKSLNVSNAAAIALFSVTSK